EQGCRLMPVASKHESAGDLEGAAATAATAAEMGQRFGDSALVALAMHTQGDIVVRSGRVSEGLGLLDEAMVTVTTETLSPVVTGIVYCGVILTCEQVFELRRARECTAALTRCSDLPPEPSAL